MRDIIVALIGFVTAVVAAGGGSLLRDWWIGRRRRHADVQDFVYEMGRMQALQTMLIDLLNDTSVDRFAIIRAENGIAAPQHATLIYSHYSNRRHRRQSFYRLQLDDEARKVCRDAEAEGEVRLKVADMPDGVMRQIYFTEGIFYVNVFFIGRQELRDGKALLTFCSIATFVDAPFSVHDNIAQKRFVDRLRAFVYADPGMQPPGD